MFTWYSDELNIWTNSGIWQLFSICLLCLSVRFCHVIKDCPFWIILRVWFLWYFTFYSPKRKLNITTAGNFSNVILVSDHSIIQQRRKIQPVLFFCTEYDTVSFIVGWTLQYYLQCNADLSPWQDYETISVYSRFNFLYLFSLFDYCLNMRKYWEKNYLASV